ncbi:MAG: PDGLE domain-containing protein [Planctomycetes bacterium]|nr:PDGLE domain-containing protein [Planctomycetota bacterium]
MHIPDGMLDAKTCVGTAVVAAGAVAYALRRVRPAVAERSAPLMGVAAACLFAAQMMNFPIPGGTSGHLLGGVLAAVILGPWSGLLVLTVVLGVQSILFQDGGITALGANLLNVGVIGSLVGYAIFEPIRRSVGGQRGTVVGAVVAAWFSVVLAASACSVELALSGDRLPLAPVLAVMLLFHSMIGLGEAIITGFALTFVLRIRPDLVYGQTSGSGILVRSAQVIVAGLALALFVAVLLSPFASPLPDGLEKAMMDLGRASRPAEPLLKAPMPEYVLSGWENVRLAGSVAGGVGTVVVFGAAFLLARGLSSKSSAVHSPHAS